MSSKTSEISFDVRDEFANNRSPGKPFDPCFGTGGTPKTQRESFWSTVLGVDSPTDLSPVSTVTMDCHRAMNSAIPKITIPEGLGLSSIPCSFGAKRTITSGRRVGISKRKSRPGAIRCELCWSTFGQRGDLMRHVRVTHLGERNYHCDECGSSFGRRSILNKHRKRHDRERERKQEMQRYRERQQAVNQQHKAMRTAEAAGALISLMHTEQ